MKKITTTLAAAIISITVMTAQQQIPNGGFEHWSVAGQGEDPDSLWYSVNQLTNSITYPVLVSKSTDAYAGEFALYIESDTATLPPPAGNNTLDTLSGFIGLNFNFNQGTSLGIPFTDRPDCISTYLKANIPTGDTSSIIVTLSNTNGVAGEAKIILSNNVSAYTNHTAPINYINAENPETLAITIFAGDGELPIQNAQSNLHPLPNNNLWVDEMKFIYGAACTVGTNNFNFKEKPKVYPNPAKDLITIETGHLNFNDINFKIFDLAGKSVYQSNLNAEKIDVDISFLNPGIYYLTIYSDKLKLREPYKFIKAK